MSDDPRAAHAAVVNSLERCAGGVCCLSSLVVFALPSLIPVASVIQCFGWDCSWRVQRVPCVPVTWACPERSAVASHNTNCECSTWNRSLLRRLSCKFVWMHTVLFFFCSFPIFCQLCNSEYTKNGETELVVLVYCIRHISPEFVKVCSSSLGLGFFDLNFFLKQSDSPKIIWVMDSSFSLLVNFYIRPIIMKTLFLLWTMDITVSCLQSQFENQM